MGKKKIVKINELQLREVVKKSVKRVLDENNVIVLNCDYRTNNVGRNIIYEMARLNKKDGSQSPFPSNKYKLWVQGDNSPHKPPHMHVYFPQDGWQIKVYIEDGELCDVVSYGNRGRSDKFIDVIKMVKEWFLLPTTMPGRIGTNQQAAANELDACNDD
jgi:hypothetical protein